MNFKYLNKIKRVIFSKEERVVPNILITNYCNQDCSFCFASGLMKKGGVKEMSLEKYEEILDSLRKNGVNRVFLMGGEPTLHTKFKKIIKLAEEKGFEIELFTNGQFSDETRAFLLKMVKNIKMYHINIASPAYRIKKKRDKINRFIVEVSKFSNVALETTIGSLDKNVFLEIFEKAKTVLDKSYIRIGVDGALVNRGAFSLVKNLKIGRIIVGAIKYLFNNKVKGVWLSEINPCMFSDNEIKKMLGDSRINWKGWGCFSKNGGVDIKTDLKVIRCFGQDCFEGTLFDGKKSLEKIKKNLDSDMVKKSKVSLPKECRLCKYYGYKNGQCPGPCLINR